MEDLKEWSGNGAAKLGKMLQDWPECRRRVPSPWSNISYEADDYVFERTALIFQRI